MSYVPCTLKQSVAAFSAAATLATALAFALSAHSVSAAPSHSANSSAKALPKLKSHQAAFATPIRHVVVVVMENRSVDNLFQKFPGADTSGSGLAPQDLMATDDPNHTYLTGFQPDFAGSWPANSLYYVNPADNYVGQVYYGLASTWVLADEMLQTNEGPSFPAHQYLIAGQSGGIANFTSPYNTAPYSG
jgi:phospholipase C